MPNDTAPDRYRPRGESLTDYEREVLEILAEEAAEVVQAAMKILRFGKETRPFRGGTLTNLAHLSREVGEFSVLCEMAQQANLLSRAEAEVGATKKRERLAIFMQTEAPKP